MEILDKYSQVFEKYLKKNTSKGKTKSNLDQEALKGLETLQKKIKEGSIVMLETDKSGKLVPTDRDTFLRMGEVHTSQDR